MFKRSKLRLLSNKTNSAIYLVYVKLLICYEPNSGGFTIAI